MKNSWRVLGLAALLVSVGFGSVALAADRPAAAGKAAPVAAAAPAAAPTARVPQGGTVTLAPSAFSQQQLAAKRPGYEDLRPRVRTNRE